MIQSAEVLEGLRHLVLKIAFAPIGSNEVEMREPYCHRRKQWGSRKGNMAAVLRLNAQEFLAPVVAVSVTVEIVARVELKTKSG